MTSPPMANAWLQRMLRERDLTEPDGRPLYAFRLSNQEFEDLVEILQQHADYRFHEWAAFCLFAAEWWRRDFVGGAWSWEGLLQKIELAGDYTSYYEPIERVLRLFWRRRVLRHRGKRRFVATFACEGGLPLQLLAREHGHLRTFFRSLLQQHCSMGLDHEDLIAAAEGLASLLPTTWRNAEVYRLASEIVAGISRLRGKLPEDISSDDPVALLDRIESSWRHELPLDMSDHIATELVRGLVRDAAEITRRRPLPLRVLTVTVTSRDEAIWSLHRLVTIPTRVAADVLQQFFARDDLPSSLNLYAQTDGQELVLIALATHWVGGSETVDRYSLEGPRHRMVAVPATGDGISMVGAAGDLRFGPVLLPGGEPLSELPWVFAADDLTVSPGGTSHERWRLLGQGSVRSREPELVVAVAPTWTAFPDHSTDLVHAGQIASENIEVRMLYRVRGGGVVFTNEDGERCRIVSGHDIDEAVSYSLTGDTVTGLSTGAPFLGLPVLQAIDGTGMIRRIAASDLEWRPRGTRLAWRPLTMECLGSVDIRYSVDDMTLYRDRAMILEASTKIQVLPGQEPGLGELRILQCSAKNATLRHDQSARSGTVSIQPTGRHAWKCLASGAPPGSLFLHLRWNGGRYLAFEVPFPGLDARFHGPDGKPIANDSDIYIGDLPGVVARFTGPPQMLCRARLRGRLRSGQIPSGFNPGFEVPFHQRAEGQAELPLSAIYEPITLGFAATSHLDAHYELVIDGIPVVRNRLVVRRYDLRLKPSRDDDAIALEEPFDPSLAERLNVDARPLWTPDAAVVNLPQIGPGRWSFKPGDHRPGPWLFVARDGDWCRARPLKIKVRPEQSLASQDDIEEFITGFADVSDMGKEPDSSGNNSYLDSIAQAARLPDSTRRRHEFLALLEQLRADPLHPGWAEFGAFVDTLGDLPASTFEVISHSLTQPMTLARSLLERADKSFESVWNGFEQLPFSWFTVSIHDWLLAARSWSHASRDALAEVPGEYRQTAESAMDAQLQRGIQSFREKAGPRAGGFELVARLMEEEVFTRTPDRNDLLAFCGDDEGRAFAHSQLEENRQQPLRLHAEIRWPDSGQIPRACDALSTELPGQLSHLLSFVTNGVSGHARPVLQAPVLAALASAWDTPLDAGTVLEIRRMRLFDKSWFANAHCWCLAIAVGIVREHFRERYPS